MYPTRPGRLHLIVALTVLIAMLFVQQQRLVELPDTGRVLHVLPNAVHGPWFAIISWMLAVFVRRWAGRRATVAITAVLGLGLAIGTEAVQKITGGDAEWSDVLFDMVGMSAALCIWSVREQLIPKRAGVTAALLLLLTTQWPLLHPVLIDRHRDSIAPELVRFDSKFARNLVASSSVTDIVIAPDGWEITGPVLKVALADEIWPGVHLDDPIADWRRYSVLDVDVFVDGATPLPITISVRLDHAPVDHVYHTFNCAPGPCRLTLQLADLFDRDIARVNAVVIYSRRAHAGRVFYLGRVSLRS